MAKIKVHELAKEVDKQSKEIIAFLQNKGVEVKVAQSSVEDEAADMVRREFGVKGAVKAEGAKTEAAAQEAPKTEALKEDKTEQKKAETKPEAAKAAKPENSAGAAKQEPVKKKKNIIFVSNPHNSKMGGQRSSAQGNNGRRNNNNNSSVINRPLIRPLTPPSPTPSVGQIKPTNPPRQNQPKKQDNNAARENTARENTARENAPQRNGGAAPAYRQTGGENRQDRRGQERTGGNNDYRSRQTDNRPGNNRFHKDTGSNQSNNGRGRGYNDNNRPERGNAREDNKFRKPSGVKAFVPETPMKDAEKHRDDEKRRMSQERDKRSRKDSIYEDGGAKGKNKPGRFIKPEKKVEEKQEEQIKTITLPETLTVKELADKMKIQPSAIVKKLFLQGQIVTVNQEISFETAEEIAIEYEIICEKEVKVDVIEELLKEEEEDEKDMTKRPPVICVMGHVDHGKTSLLDAIRKTNVTDREAGGITQHIGAYTVNINGERITFLDTPGHEAFTAMRMRGANSTDIAILVVAADDGVMPQTVEAINHAKAAGIEIIVAVNKIDKPNANIDRVKQEMTEYELIPVDWGGSTEFVPVSAKSGEGIETLLETILLTAEILELKANAKRRARGLVIEAELDRGRGPVATVLVQKGTLHVGDFISAGASHGKVRAMIDDKGRRVKEAGPSTPVEILGLSDVPNAGEIFIAHENDKTAKSYADTYLAQNKEKKLEETKSKMSLDDLFTQIQAGNLKELNLIIKADVQGSVEAVKQSLLKLSNEEVVVKCIHGGVGAINESDVTLASASNAIIIGFNIRPDATAKAIAEREGVDIRLYRVIYQAIEDIEAAMKGMLDPVFEEKVIGHAEVRQIFRASAVGNIAGAYVLDGVFQRNCKIRITREGEQIFEGNLASLKRFKDDVKEVKAGFECGLVFEGFDQMQELDIVEAYIMVEVPR
ncbi:MAG: translation initiation factor IF-2 [Lachnospiraceae bacterium]|nr:translation initiation factor IF-2 [Lachnospiraceae bacterium]